MDLTFGTIKKVGVKYVKDKRGNVDRVMTLSYEIADIPSEVIDTLGIHAANGMPVSLGVTLHQPGLGS